MGLIPYLEECMDGGEVTTPLLSCEPTLVRADTESRRFSAFIYPVRGEAGRLLGVQAWSR